MNSNRTRFMRTRARTRFCLVLLCGHDPGEGVGYSAVAISFAFSYFHAREPHDIAGKEYGWIKITRVLSH